MDKSTSALCKVIVYDSDAHCEMKIKQFCDENHLLAVKSQSGHFLDVLRSNVDLGALFLSSDLNDNGVPLYKSIHKIRPELPIILRNADQNTIVNTPGDRLICTSYSIDTIDSIRQTINEYIFNKQYPNALIRGVEEITQECLTYLFPNTVLDSSFPYLVNDRIIHGQLFSLIPLESSWCRGYMMIQADQDNILDLVKKGAIAPNCEKDFRVVNDILGEITNMIWGKIRNRYVAEEEQTYVFPIHVPIIVNHQNKYITFGAGVSQLCFKYTLTQKDDNKKSITLYQKFVFNLSWNPEKFHENRTSVDDLIASGFLELF